MEDYKWSGEEIKEYKMFISWWEDTRDHIRPVCELSFESIMFLFFYHTGLCVEDYEKIRELLGVDETHRWTLHMSNNQNPPFNNIVAQRKTNLGHNPTVVIYAGPNKNGDCYTNPNEAPK